MPRVETIDDPRERGRSVCQCGEFSVVMLTLFFDWNTRESANVERVNAKARVADIALSDDRRHEGCSNDVRFRIIGGSPGRAMLDRDARSTIIRHVFGLHGKVCRGWIRAA